MIKALDLGVTTLEMDAVITKDSQVVLSHEPFFNHEISTSPDGLPISEATEKQHNIFQLDYAQVKRYDVGLAKHPRFPRQEKIAAVKPLLAELFDAADAHAKKQSGLCLFTILKPSRRHQQTISFIRSPEDLLSY